MPFIFLGNKLQPNECILMFKKKKKHCNACSLKLHFHCTLYHDDHVILLGPNSHHSPSI